MSQESLVPVSAPPESSVTLGGSLPSLCLPLSVSGSLMTMCSQAQGTTDLRHALSQITVCWENGKKYCFKNVYIF